MSYGLIFYFIFRYFLFNCVHMGRSRAFLFFFSFLSLYLQISNQSRDFHAWRKRGKRRIICTYHLSFGEILFIGHATMRQRVTRASCRKLLEKHEGGKERKRALENLNWKFFFSSFFSFFFFCLKIFVRDLIIEPRIALFTFCEVSHAIICYLRIIYIYIYFFFFISLFNTFNHIF